MVKYNEIALYHSKEEPNFILPTPSWKEFEKELLVDVAANNTNENNYEVLRQWARIHHVSRLTYVYGLGTENHP